MIYTHDRLGRRQSLGALTVFAACVLGGCCTYRSADGDPGIPQLLGHQCVLAEATLLPTGGSHWLPGFTPPTPYPLVNYLNGTVLRVSHVEAWDGPIDPSGTIVFADVQNGPRRGARVVIGYLGTPHGSVPASVICVSPPILGVTPEAGRCLRPFGPTDVGIF
jgi:hypothetical protein